MTNPVKSGFFEDKNFGISYSKCNNIIHIFSAHYSVRVP